METTENGTQTNGKADTIIVSETFQKVMDFKLMLEALSRDKAQTEALRRYARGALRPINDLISQAMVELTQPPVPTKAGV